MKILGYETSHADIRLFESRINKKDNECWLWTGGKNTDGYGYFRPGHGISLRAHRFYYELHVGRIPKGLQLDHLCRVRHCVNPQHLEPVTHKENHRRGYWSSRKDCSYGHPYITKNIFYDKKGYRVCRICKNRQTRKTYWRRKEKMASHQISP